MSAFKRKRGQTAAAKKAKKAKFVADRGEAAVQAGEEQKNEVTVPAPVSMGKWTNKERVLIFSSRGINFRTRHLMQDLRTLMPHSKADTKMDRKDKLFIINEVCEIKNCNKCLFFEAKKKQDLYMWIANSPHGPSAKFLVQNIHTLAELKMTGNCLKGSRPLLSFDPSLDNNLLRGVYEGATLSFSSRELPVLRPKCQANIKLLRKSRGLYCEAGFTVSEKFDKEPHFALLKELFTQTFSTPRYHPKSQPFVDHVITFTIADNRIWFRNYQIIEEDASLVEVGPRFVLNLIKIFQGSFGGPTLFENPEFTSPNMHRREIRLAAAARVREKQMVKEMQKMKRAEAKDEVTRDVTADVFLTPADEKPVSIQTEAPAPKVVKKNKHKAFKRQRMARR